MGPLVVLAYSGGLDTSVILNWLKDTYSAEVVAFCADIGQEEELDGLEEKALKTGASKCFVDDLCEEFARDFIFPMMQAAAIYEGQYFLGTSIARPLIANNDLPKILEQGREIAERLELLVAVEGDDVRLGDEAVERGTFHQTSELNFVRASDHDHAIAQGVTVGFIK